MIKEHELHAQPRWWSLRKFFTGAWLKVIALPYLVADSDLPLVALFVVVLSGATVWLFLCPMSRVYQMAEQLIEALWQSQSDTQDLEQSSYHCRQTVTVSSRIYLTHLKTKQNGIKKKKNTIQNKNWRPRRIWWFIFFRANKYESFWHCRLGVEHLQFFWRWYIKTCVPFFSPETLFHFSTRMKWNLCVQLIMANKTTIKKSHRRWCVCTRVSADL